MVACRFRCCSPVTICAIILAFAVTAAADVIVVGAIGAVIVTAFAPAVYHHIKVC